MNGTELPERHTEHVLSTTAQHLFRIVDNNKNNPDEGAALDLRGPADSRLRQDLPRIVFAYRTALMLNLPLTPKSRKTLSKAAPLMAAAEQLQIYHQFWQLLNTPRITGEQLTRALSEMAQDGVLAQTLKKYGSDTPDQGPLQRPHLTDRQLKAAGHAHDLGASIETKFAVLLYLPSEGQDRGERQAHAEQAALQTVWQLVQTGADHRTVSEIGRLILNHPTYHPEYRMSDEELYAAVGKFGSFWQSGIETVTAYHQADSASLERTKALLDWRARVIARTQLLIGQRGLPQ